MKVTFLKDYIWKSGNTCPRGYIGCPPDIISYKKGDNFTGYRLSLSEDKKQVSAYMGNYTILIPVEYVTILNDDGTPFVDSNVNGSGETFLQKHKNHLLILGGLVIAYIAYKKFNK